MSIRMLVVDDDDVDVYLLRHTLPKGLVELRHEMTLASAITQIARDVPDLVLVDLHLPDGYGVDNLMTIRRATSVPVAVMSGTNERDAKEKCVAAGAVAFIQKGSDDATRQIIELVEGLRPSEFGRGRVK